MPNAAFARSLSSNCWKWLETLRHQFNRRVQPDGRLQTHLLRFGAFLGTVSLCLVAQAEESSVPSQLIGFEKESVRGSSPAANRFALGITLKLPATVVEETRAGALTGFGHWGLSYYARFLERPSNQSFRIPFLHRRGQAQSGALTLGKLGAGYGQVFAEDSVLARNRNGTALEEPSFLFLKATFRF